MKSETDMEPSPNDQEPASKGVALDFSKPAADVLDDEHGASSSRERKPGAPDGFVAALRSGWLAAVELNLLPPTVFVLLLVVANAFLGATGQPTAFLACLLVNVVVGWAIIARLFWPAIERLPLRGSGWLIGAAAAVVVYVGRVNALTEVNAVFGVDPAALPLTVAAALVFRIGRLLEWGVAAAAIGSLLALVLLVMQLGSLGEVRAISKVFDRMGGEAHPDNVSAREALAMDRVGVMLVMLLLSASLVVFLIFRLPDYRAKATIFRVGVSTDFVDSFDCKGFPPKGYRALFLGPEQRRALFVSKPGEAAQTPDAIGEIFSGAALPNSLRAQVAECEPAADHPLQLDDHPDGRSPDASAPAGQLSPRDAKAPLNARAAQGPEVAAPRAAQPTYRLSPPADVASTGPQRPSAVGEAAALAVGAGSAASASTRVRP